MKTEFILFSDLHAHNFVFGASRVPIAGVEGLYNSRLRDTVEILDYIKKYRREHDIPTVIFGGDLFHNRSSVTTDVRSIVTDRLMTLTDNSGPNTSLILTVGNHDMGDKHGHVNALTGFDHVPTIAVADTIRFYNLGTIQVVCIPYTSSLDQAKEWLKQAGEAADTVSSLNIPTILIAHLGMQGAVVGSDYVLVNDSDIRSIDVPHDKFAACFFGHFHQHQQLFDNGWYIGATHQHNWGDEGGSRGFLHVIVQDNEVSFKQIETHAPKFLTIKEDSNIIPRPQDFVHYIGSEEFVSSTGNIGAHIQRTIEFEEDLKEFTLDISKLDPMSMLEAWVNNQSSSDLDENELLQVGRKLLSEVL